jgi:D-alanine-D-alanine ligase-like ATP-grasp enzyme
MRSRALRCRREILPSREFYDYAAKYLDDGEQASKLLIPAPLDAELTKQVRAMAVKAFKAIDGAGMSRVDFLLSAETGALYLNEINTIPVLHRSACIRSCGPQPACRTRSFWVS